MRDTQLRLQESPRLDANCPRCHQPATSADANCATCLSPHHAECWDQGSRCARCGGTTHFVMMDLPGQTPRAVPRPGRFVLQPRFVAIALLVGVTAGWLILR